MKNKLEKQFEGKFVWEKGENLRAKKTSIINVPFEGIQIIYDLKLHNNMDLIIFSVYIPTLIKKKWKDVLYAYWGDSGNWGKTIKERILFNHVVLPCFNSVPLPFKLGIKFWRRGKQKSPSKITIPFKISDFFQNNLFKME